MPASSSLIAERRRILAGGIMSLIVMLGIARFAYTSMIPGWSRAGLSPDVAG